MWEPHDRTWVICHLVGESRRAQLGMKWTDGLRCQGGWSAGAAAYRHLIGFSYLWVISAGTGTPKYWALRRFPVKKLHFWSHRYVYYFCPEAPPTREESICCLPFASSIPCQCLDLRYSVVSEQFFKLTNDSPSWHHRTAAQSSDWER